MTIRAIKHAALGVLKETGAFRSLAESQWRRDRLLILCYHGVSLADEHVWKPDYFVTEQLFEERLETLRSGGYTVLPFQEALKRLYAKQLPPKSVTITFDDGMYDFYAKALPILKKYSVPSTLYLSTYYCTHPLPVFPLLISYLLWKAKGKHPKANPGVGWETAPDLETDDGFHEAWLAVYSTSTRKALNSQQEFALTRDLAAHLQIPFEPIMEQRIFHAMTPQEVKDAANQGVDIQLHTHRHRTPNDRVLFLKEIVENREEIKAILGTEATHFCYPSGVHKPQFLPWLKEERVISATTCDQGLATAKTDPLLLPRFLDTANISRMQFESWLVGVGSYIPRNPLRKRRRWDLK